MVIQSEIIDSNYLAQHARFHELFCIFFLQCVEEENKCTASFAGAHLKCTGLPCQPETIPFALSTKCNLAGRQGGGQPENCRRLQREQFLQVKFNVQPTA